MDFLEVDSSGGGGDGGSIWKKRNGMKTGSKSKTWFEEEGLPLAFIYSIQS